MARDYYSRVCVLIAAALCTFLLTHLTRRTLPAWQRVTFAKGKISSARFAHNGQTIIYSAAWNGRPLHLFTTTLESPESRPLDVRDGNLLSVSAHGGLAISKEIRIIGPDTFLGTLATAPLEGGTPRELAHSVIYADWSPDGANLAAVRRIGGRSVLEFPLGHASAESAGGIAFPRVSPAGDRVAYFAYPDPTVYAGQVVLADRNGNKTVLSDDWTDLTGLAWAPDGKAVWFTGSRTANYSALHSVALDGKERLLLKEPTDLQLFDIASDGRVLIAAVNWRAEIHAVSDEDQTERDLSWLDFSSLDDVSEDGRTVIFHEGGDGGGAEFTSYLRLEDGAPTKLTEGTCMGISPSRQQVVCTALKQPSPLTLIPTGAGTAHTLPADQLTHLNAKWLAMAGGWYCWPLNRGTVRGFTSKVSMEPPLDLSRRRGFILSTIRGHRRMENGLQPTSGATKSLSFPWTAETHLRFLEPTRERPSPDGPRTAGLSISARVTRRRSFPASVRDPADARSGRRLLRPILPV